jgi:predicted dehydrogenase
VFTILGSGFGLYGYLAAVVGACREDVVLPERSREPFLRRPELAHCADRIKWVDDEAQALALAEDVVVAKRPLDQQQIVAQCLGQANVRRMILEKPLAPTPEASSCLLDEIARSDKRVRIGYTFRHTHWASRFALVTSESPKETIEVEWRFLAHHHENEVATWKRDVSAGGGVLRFYGIHLLALLAELGYSAVERSEADGKEAGELDRWRATLVGDRLPRCTVSVDSRSAGEGFIIRRRSTGSEVVRLQDPFDRLPPEPSSPDDRRVPMLARLLRSFAEEDRPLYDSYSSTNELWQAAERLVGH